MIRRRVRVKRNSEEQIQQTEGEVQVNQVDTNNKGDEKKTVEKKTSNMVEEQKKTK